MLDLYIDKSPNTPKVDFKFDEGVLKIEGRAIPENPNEFFKPIFEWVDEYFKQPKELTTVVIKLEYINSGSSKSLLEFLRHIKEHHNNGNNCLVKWYFEEDDESVQN